MFIKCTFCHNVYIIITRIWIFRSCFYDQTFRSMIHSYTALPFKCRSACFHLSLVIWALLYSRFSNLSVPFFHRSAVDAGSASGVQIGVLAQIQSFPMFLYKFILIARCCILVLYLLFQHVTFPAFTQTLTICSELVPLVDSGSLLYNCNSL